MNLYKLARAVVKVYYKCAFRIKVEGIENIPTDDNFIVCANHKSLNDPLLLAATLPVELKFMAKEELFINKLFGVFLKSLGAFPVKRGTGDIGALKIAIKTLGCGDNLVIFPEGSRSPKGHMHKGKSGAVLIATKSKVNILPIGIYGSYKLFSKIAVRIGEPIKLDEYFGKKNDSETLQQIMDTRVMQTISELSEVPTYENRDSE